MLDTTQSADLSGAPTDRRKRKLQRLAHWTSRRYDTPHTLDSATGTIFGSRVGQAAQWEAALWWWARVDADMHLIDHLLFVGVRPSISDAATLADIAAGRIARKASKGGPSYAAQARTLHVRWHLKHRFDRALAFCKQPPTPCEMPELCSPARTRPIDFEQALQRIQFEYRKKGKGSRFDLRGQVIDAMAEYLDEPGSDPPQPLQGREDYIQGIVDRAAPEEEPMSFEQCVIRCA